LTILVVTTIILNMASELQAEIKQTKPFSSLEEEVALNLQRTAYLLGLKNTESIKSADLTPTQYNALRILRGAGEAGLACGEISDRLITKDSDITRLLERLENREFIVRERDAGDRRVIIAKITGKGLQILQELDEPIMKGNKENLEHLGKDLLEQLNALLVLARKKVK
jgi:DNA-binding MarR family transcriptional regulator